MSSSEHKEHFELPTRLVDKATVNRTAGIFDSIEPFSGNAKAGRAFNFVGALLPEHITREWPEAAKHGVRQTERPKLKDGEVFAEWYSTIRSIELASESYFMISLGAHLGGPIINASKLVQCYKPMKTRYLGIEGDPNMCEIARSNIQENNIEPTSVVIIQAAISNSPRPTLFACSTIPSGSTQLYYDEEKACNHIQAQGLGNVVTESLIRNGTTKIPVNIITQGDIGELRMVSTTTLYNIVNPHQRIDYMEIDIQGTEYFVLPPCMDLLNERVAWIHLGTHVDEEHHKTIRSLFVINGWEVLIDWLPNSTYITPDSQFQTSDGVLSMCNPRLTNLG